MKTLTKNNISLYLFDDNEVVEMTSENITVGNPAEFIINDCNSTNSVLHEGVTEPAEWTGHKYLYDGGWALNPDWVEPSQPAE